MNRIERWIIPSLAAMSLAALATACSGGGPSTTSPSTPPTPAPSPTVTAMAVSGTAPKVGAASQFSATATLSNDVAQGVTTQAAWTSSDQSIVTVNGAGLVSGVGSGDADVTAVYLNVSGKAHVTIASVLFAVSGTITDGTSGGVLPGISVTAASKTTSSDTNGKYSLSSIVAGSVTVSASATGYQTVSKNISLSSDTTVDLVLARTPAPSPSPTPTPTPTPAPSPTPTPAPGSNICTVSSPIAASCGTATAICNDKTYSCSQNRSGTCSSHSGVSCWICPGPLCNP